MVGDLRSYFHWFGFRNFQRCENSSFVGRNAHSFHLKEDTIGCISFRNRKEISKRLGAKLAAFGFEQLDLGLCFLLVNILTRAEISFVSLTVVAKLIAAKIGMAQAIIMVADSHSMFMTLQETLVATFTVYLIGSNMPRTITRDVGISVFWELDFGGSVAARPGNLFVQSLQNRRKAINDQSGFHRSFSYVFADRLGKMVSESLAAAHRHGKNAVVVAIFFQSRALLLGETTLRKEVVAILGTKFRDGKGNEAWACKTERD